MRNQQGGGGGGKAAARAAPGPSTREGLRWEPLEARHSETGGWAHRLRQGLGAALIVLLHLGQLTWSLNNSGRQEGLYPPFTDWGS